MGSHGSHDSSAAHALRVTSELEQSQGGTKRSGAVQAAFCGQLGCEVPLCPAVRFSSHRWAQSSAGIPPDMPENLRQIMDDYAAWLATATLCLAESMNPFCMLLAKERRRAEEDAKQSLLSQIVNSTAGAVIGAAIAGGIVWLPLSSQAKSDMCCGISVVHFGRGM